MTVPTLTQEQRREAYAKSLRLRRDRSILKGCLRAGRDLLNRPVTFAQALEFEIAQGMKIYDLLLALPGIGKAKAGYLLKSAGIPEKNTVRGCGPKQKERLLALLG